MKNSLPKPPRLSRPQKERNFPEVVPSLEPTKRYKTVLKDKALSPTEVETLLRHFDEGMDALSGQLHKFQLIQNFLSNLD